MGSMCSGMLQPSVVDISTWLKTALNPLNQLIRMEKLLKTNGSDDSWHEPNMYSMYPQAMNVMKAQDCIKIEGCHIAFLTFRHAQLGVVWRGWISTVQPGAASPAGANGLQDLGLWMPPIAGQSWDQIPRRVEEGHNVKIAQDVMFISFYLS